jgi:hypothetical protein
MPASAAATPRFLKAQSARHFPPGAIGGPLAVTPMRPGVKILGP